MADVKWGLRFPDVDPETPGPPREIACDVCGKTFQPPLRGKQRFCLECRAKGYKWIHRQIGSKSVAEVRAHRKEREERLKKTAPGDGKVYVPVDGGEFGVFDYDVETAKLSTLEEVDEFIRYEEMIGLTPTVDLNEILGFVERDGFIYGKSATQSPKRLATEALFDLTRLEEAISHKDPEKQSYWAKQYLLKKKHNRMQYLLRTRRGSMRHPPVVPARGTGDWKDGWFFPVL